MSRGRDRITTRSRQRPLKAGPMRKDTYDQVERTESRERLAAMHGANCLQVGTDLLWHTGLSITSMPAVPMTTQRSASPFPSSWLGPPVWRRRIGYVVKAAASSSPPLPSESVARTP